MTKHEHIIHACKFAILHMMADGSKGFSNKNGLYISWGSVMSWLDKQQEQAEKLNECTKTKCPLINPINCKCKSTECPYYTQTKDVFVKTDVVTMLDELIYEIDELYCKQRPFTLDDTGVVKEDGKLSINDIHGLIQEKINTLKGKIEDE